MLDCFMRFMKIYKRPQKDFRVFALKMNAKTRLLGKIFR